MWIKDSVVGMETCTMVLNNLRSSIFSNGGVKPRKRTYQTEGIIGLVISAL
jgi:hypothetical protein